MVFVLIVSLAVYFGTKSSSGPSPSPTGPPIPSPTVSPPITVTGELEPVLITANATVQSTTLYTGDPFGAPPIITITDTSLTTTEVDTEDKSGFTASSTLIPDIYLVSDATFNRSSLPTPAFHIPGTSIVLSVIIVGHADPANAHIYIQRSENNGVTWDNNQTPSFTFSDIVGFTGPTDDSVVSAFAMQKNGSGVLVPKLVFVQPALSSGQAASEYCPVVVLEATSLSGESWTHNAIFGGVIFAPGNFALTVSPNDVMTISRPAYTNNTLGNPNIYNYKYLPNGTHSSGVTIFAAVNDSDIFVCTTADGGLLAVILFKFIGPPAVERTYYSKCVSVDATTANLVWPNST